MIASNTTRGTVVVLDPAGCDNGMTGKSVLGAYAGKLMFA